MMRRNKLYENYDRDPDSNAYIIQILLDSYDDVYDDWDPSPFKLRDIEDEFLDFLWDSVEDIPKRDAIIFEFSIPASLKNEQKELILVSALQHHFDYMRTRNERKRRKENLEALKYFLLGIFFFIVAYMGPFKSETLPVQILKEGLLIGGWVFIWETISNVFIESRELNEERLIIKRFIQAKISFVEKKDLQA
jgi:hypothetical protein